MTRAAFGRVGQHAHRLRQALEDLLRSGDAVPPSRDRPEAVVDRDGRVAERLDLLQYRVGPAPGKETSPGNSSTGRRLACATAAAVTMFVAPGPIELVQAIMRRRRLCLGKGDSGQRHRLLVMRPQRRQALALLHTAPRPSPATLPWPKIAKTPAKRGYFSAVDLAVLRREEANKRLGHREPDCGHSLVLQSAISLQGPRGYRGVVLTIASIVILGGRGNALAFWRLNRTSPSMISFCQFGAGRIGAIHAGNIAGHPRRAAAIRRRSRPRGGRAIGRPPRRRGRQSGARRSPTRPSMRS